MAENTTSTIRPAEWLYLVRHGEAKPAQEDPERPLTERGQQQARRTAAWLAATGLPVERIMHSGKRRAEQTAEIMAGHLSPPPHSEAVAGLAPNDDVRPMAEAAQRQGPALMLVGHLPFLSRLVGCLTAGDPHQAPVLLEPAGMAIMRRLDGQWLLYCVVQPALLP